MKSRSIRRACMWSGALLIATIFTMFLIGCSTVENVRTVQQVLPYTDGELTMTATVLSSKELIARYGTDSPFIAPHRFLTPFEFFVIEISIIMPDDFGVIERDRILLDFSIYRDLPRSIRRMIALWETEIEVHGPEAVSRRYKRVIRSSLLGENVSGSAIGLLVFRGQFPYAGNAILSIPHPNPERSERAELATLQEIRDTYLEPVFDGKKIYFNFQIDSDRVERGFKLF